MTISIDYKDNIPLFNIMSAENDNVWNFLSDDCINDYSLIIPSVAVGNVAQLTCDLIISSLNMKKIASVYSSAIIPIVGYDPYDLNSDSPSTSCEIYRSDTKKILIMQLRAPLIFEYSEEFLQDVVRTFQARNIKEVIILTSCFAYEKRDILSSSYRYLANKLCGHKDQAKSLNWQEHESGDGEVRIFGGGFALMMYRVCEQMSMPCLMIYKYCSEGDNIPDAYDMINHLNGVLPLFVQQHDVMSQLIQPVSWKLLFGRPPPQEIY